MQRPLEEEARQEDRAELLGGGSRSSHSLPASLGELPLSLHPACV